MLRTRLNLVVTGLTAAFVIVLVVSQIRSARASIREEIAAANRVAAQLLRPLAAVYSQEGGPQLLLQFLDQLGRVRANDIRLESATGEVYYRSPPSPWKAGREAPDWFARLLAPEPARQEFPMPGGVRLIVEANSSRALVDAWDDFTRLAAVAVLMLAIANGLAFWLVRRTLAPFPVIVRGLERIQRGDLGYRLPPLSGTEAAAIGSAFNGMAQAVEDKVLAERKAREAETRLEEGRELARVVEQRIEEERRLIAHELHDEFGQSVTAIRSMALAIATQAGGRDRETDETARLIAKEAGRLYDAMHGLIPRLVPLSLDTMGLAASIEALVRDWQRRYPAIELSVRHDLASELGQSLALAIYRVVQEGLINAVRHAQPANVDVSVRCNSGHAVIVVEDDGVGLPKDWERPGHFGLRGLRERVERLGGALRLEAVHPHGTRLTADIPLTGQSA